MRTRLDKRKNIDATIFPKPLLHTCCKFVNLLFVKLFIVHPYFQPLNFDAVFSNHGHYAFRDSVSDVSERRQEKYEVTAFLSNYFVRNNYLLIQYVNILQPGRVQ